MSAGTAAVAGPPPGDRLRIAQVSTPHESTPPIAYGSINRIVADLTDELVSRGHEVHLYATGDSTTRGVLHAPYPHPDPDFVNVGQDWMHALGSMRDITGFDVVHNHNLFTGQALSFLAGCRVALTTAHFFTYRDHDLMSRTGPANYVVQSRSQQHRMRHLNVVGTAQPGIRVEEYPLGRGDDGYLLVLGQIGDHKGVREAIGVARRARLPLIIAGPVPPWHQEYFERQVRPWLGPDVQYVGEVGGDVRLELLRRARGVLMLSKGPETFGLVCVEAMACGTPVVVTGRGALPEVVRHGVTGFVADTEEEQCAAVHRLQEIAPDTCRAHVEENYTVGHMTDRYETIYRALLPTAWEASAPDIGPAPRPEGAPTP
ncbi:glycosyltransferase family 4 protein [Streptomyces pactum]|uniref:D-inositol 3-phosphate glycosyltransferase n=1 Tax=Streptomyces pactum TaxID=68249 RepID=A0ABS0NL49_9ACTN|nr:glycosyltransferase family 4 protein [Streptomyces pactum]MBH5335917.1 glycosyltransferase family 4 protein [Streptomyces pactum]